MIVQNMFEDMLMELLRREKNAGIFPDEELDLFIKVCFTGGVAL